MQMAKRQVFGGKAADIAAVIGPLAVQAKKPGFCTYSDESEKVSDAKLNVSSKKSEGGLLSPDNILVLSALKALCPSLSFGKKIVMKTMAIIYKDNKSTWKLTKAEQNDWQDKMTRRIRNMCRCCRQGEVKAMSARTPPGWVGQLPWNTSSQPSIGEVLHPFRF